MPYVDPAAAMNLPTVRIRTDPIPPDEAYSRMLLVGNATIRVVQITFQRGEKTIPHYHPRAAEFFYIVAGSAEMWIGEGPPIHSTPGDFLFAPQRVVHAIVAGDDGVRLLAGMGPNDREPDEQVEVELGGYPT